MDFDASAQVDALAKLPPEPPKPPPGRWNGWSAPLRGLAAGAAEVGAFAADAAKGYGQIMSAGGTERAAGMFGGQTEAERRESELQRIKLTTEGVDTTSESGTALRDVARDYRPDPATAGLAERLTFDLTRFLGKAVGYSVLGAGVPGAVALGADESMVVADDLMREGVDPATRMKAGMVAGVAAAAGVVLPVAAPGSVAKTVGLWALGGPGAFVAQQAATREILASANYGDLAAQYDPLDPVGLAVSSLVPAGFAAWAMRSARVRPIKPDAPPVPTPEQVDAVMTHNLTLARDVHEASTPPAATSDPTSFASRLEVAIVERGLAVEMGERSMASGEAGARKITIADMPENEFMAKHGNSVDDVKAHEFAHTFWHGATGLPNFRDPANKALRAELRLASKEFRPFVWEANSKHANSADELLADGMAFWIKNPDRRADFPAIDKMMRGYDAGDLIRNFPDSPRPAPLPAEAIPPRPTTEVDAFATRMAASEDPAVRNVHEDSATPMVQELHEADLATKAIPETDRVEDLRGNSFDSMFEGYEKSADDLASMLEDMGFQTRRESSRVSMSEYIYAKTPDYAENDTGEPISGRELKFRLSNHTLPSSYEQVHFDVAVFDADNLRPDVGGDITDALRWASEASGVAPNGEAKRLIGERAAQKAAAANAEAARLAAANDARQQTLDLAHAFISRQPDGATIGVSKRKRMTATLDGKIIDTLDTFPRDWASGTQAEKGQAPKMAKADALVFLEGKGAAPANSRELGSHAPEGAGMQERPAVRADESGSLEGPAQSDSAGGGESKTTGQGGKSQDPHIASTLSSVEALKAQSPDLPVALREDGTPVTLSEELDAIRRQAREGTADTFATRMAASDDAAVRNVGEGIRRAADVLGPEQMAAITRAADTYMQAREAGTPIAKAVEDLNLPPEVTNLVAGIVENAHSAPRIEALAREVMKTVEDFKTTSAGVTADAVERLRTLTDEQITGAQAKAQKSNVEPMLASMQERIARIEQMVPDMVVRTDDTGQPVTVAKEMARIREEARKGTDTELGADDADLVSVAANCTLSVGA